ncbi:MAG TPA: homoserine O-acetyltransferase [Pseudonocardiaceae bacterium]|jgi:homoserine O-acetyltransferase|nr:homoserine O-acetyltransferase [Pseudonocardiaceae bacterium]
MTQTITGPPVTGAWREGDPVGGRNWFVADAGLTLESGEVLPGYRLAYETWGTLAEDGSNAILIEHALTADSHVAGPAGPGHPLPGWWDGLIGPGRAFDPARWFIVAANVLGGCQGSTGPASPASDNRFWGSRFPQLTIRDQVATEVALADALGIGTWAMVLGGSMGGMRALEWAVGQPDRVAALAVIAAPAQSSADQIAWSWPQLRAILDDPGWHGGDYHDLPAGAGPHLGLGLARRIAHITYRGEGELRERFGREPQAGENPARGGRFAIESYLDHHAEKLIGRFDAASYVTLVRSMNSHDVGRGRGGVASALRRIRADTVVAGVDSDRLYPLAQQAEIAAGVPNAAPLAVISSPYGHDAFLLETEQISQALAQLIS